MKHSASQAALASERLHFRINGESHEIVAPVNKTLLEILREDLGLAGTKHGCELGECGTCTVLIDGEPVLSCLVLPIEVQGHEILTVEGLAKGDQPHELQVAFVELGAAQCGYCTPGFILAVKALLDENPNPTEEEVGEYLVGNLCRCGCYPDILRAVEAAKEAKD